MDNFVDALVRSKMSCVTVSKINEYNRKEFYPSKVSQVYLANSYKTSNVFKPLRKPNCCGYKTDISQENLPNVFFSLVFGIFENVLRSYHLCNVCK